MEITYNVANVPLGALITAGYLRSKSEVIPIKPNDCNSIKFSDNSVLKFTVTNPSSVICRALANAFPSYNLYGQSITEQGSVDTLLSFSSRYLKIERSNKENNEVVQNKIEYLNNLLATRTFLVSSNLTIADFSVYAALYCHPFFKNLLNSKTVPEHLARWFGLINSFSFVTETISTLPREATDLLSVKKTRRSLSISPSRTSIKPPKNDNKVDGKFVDLPNAVMGEVVVRFPPEASGYLHIGHAKAALLNQYYQVAFNGKLIMRFDDTNPAKENVEFENVILKDVDMLQIKPDRFTYSSDYFDQMLELCEKLIKDGKAFADDTDPETMKLEREQRQESKNRNNSVARNFEMWKEMLSGTELGQKCCIRAKIDMSSDNGCMRDPTIYRCKNEPHPRTGNKYKVYPTYDFACPIVDAVEGVTHTLRTMEYHDRDDQFYWFIEALGLRRPYIWEYSRLSMTNTVLSKRKLTWFVEQGLVDGWDDPRMPTVRGVLRRGMTVEGLRQFIISQGSSRSVVFMEWDKIWAINKKIIDPFAPRYTALEENPVNVKVKNCKTEILTVPKHPKNPELGTKQITIGENIWIDASDALVLKENENATFINWGNLKILKINSDAQGKIVDVIAEQNLDNKDYKKTPKLTWLCCNESTPLTPTSLVYFDHIISKPLLAKDEDFKKYVGHSTRTDVAMWGDCDLKILKEGDIIELQRRGFFRVDKPYKPATQGECKPEPIILFAIPDGTAKKPAIPNKTKSPESSTTTSNSDSINQAIVSQGNKVRQLKGEKAAKDVVDAAVKELLALKAEFKKVTGADWKPTPEKPIMSDSGALNQAITNQGNKVRQLKGEKAAKDVVDTAVKELLALKAEFKKQTGADWKPTPEPASGNATEKNSEAINQAIGIQGNKVRQLKGEKAAKDVVDAAVKELLALKAEFKKVTGADWKPTPEKPIMSDSGSLNQAITNQGNKVRQLKSEKAAKDVVDTAVKELLALKAEFKKQTGADWKPTTEPASGDSTEKNSEAINQAIGIQGNKVRQLKGEKAAKDVVDAAVKELLALKAEFKKVTGADWKPTPEKPIISDSGALNQAITNQGNKVRQLKSEKAAKDVVDTAVKELLALKAEFKKQTGADWKPTPEPTTVTEKSSDSINQAIVSQGNKVRQLKSDKAAKDVVDAAVKELLALKGEFKKITGADWKPSQEGSTATKPKPSSNMVVSDADGSSKSPGDINKAIQEQGDIVRKLKGDKAAKEVIDAAVKQLLSLKNDFKVKTGIDWKPGCSVPDSGATVKESTVVTAKATAKSKPSKAAPKKAEVKQEDSSKKQTRLCLEAKKSENLSDWYSQVITKSEMIEYYDVSGCYIYRPWSFSIWLKIREFFEAEIRKLGVQECYFPIFVSKAALEREKTHIADFAPEVAWVTKSGESELAEPIAVRPTSETIMYSAYAKWVQSYRDLPIKLNQWNNVVRWEFKHPQPFLRTREFLWQEGHTAFASKAEAEIEILDILELYSRIYTDLLAVPVIKGRKTEKEKFAGGDYTTTVEGYVAASGRGVQGATSHHLGQNFSKMFDITYEDPETQEKKFIYQNSWGISTRSIGVMIMVHSDDQGLVLPPNVACIQIILVPCGITASLSAEDREKLLSSCKALESDLRSANIRCEGDYRDNYSPGWKFNHWELKGVPIRVELGPKDLKNDQLVAVRRDTGEKTTVSRKTAVADLGKMLKDIHDNLYAVALKDLNDHKKICYDWTTFVTQLELKNLLLSPFCGAIECEDQIKADSTRDDGTAEPGAPAMGAKSLCIPFDQPSPITEADKCIHPKCQRKPQKYTLFGRSY